MPDDDGSILIVWPVNGMQRQQRLQQESFFLSSRNMRTTAFACAGCRSLFSVGASLIGAVWLEVRPFPVHGLPVVG